MPTTLNFKDVLDLPEWRPLSNSPALNSVGVGLGFDLRNNEDRHTEIFQMSAAAGMYKYNPKNDGWLPMASPALPVAPLAGNGCVFVPSSGPSGTLAAGWSTTSGALTTALAAAVSANSLANRGGGTQGFKIRIIGNSAGGSGKTEEKYITANTAGTTPTITLDSALSFTPQSGDRYEILSGRFFMCVSGAAGGFKYYDAATNSYSGNLTITNLPAAFTIEGEMIVLDELYTPNNQAPGAGIFGNLVATASGATSITGPASGADANRAANEFNNFQIRVVTDTGTPTSVGQRRRITANTSASSTVYTVAAWAVTPSTTATFVVEYVGDILFWTSGVTTTYSYAAGGFRADAAWSTSTVSGGTQQYAVRPAAIAAGCCAWLASGQTIEVPANNRASYIFSLRGAAGAVMDLFDFSNGANGTWTASLAYGNMGAVLALGTCAAYDPVTNGGRYTYINQSATQQMFRFDNRNQTLEPWGQLRYANGTAVCGKKIATFPFIDGSTKMNSVIYARSSAVEMFQCFVSR